MVFQVSLEAKRLSRMENQGTPGIDVAPLLNMFGQNVLTMNEYFGRDSPIIQIGSNGRSIMKFLIRMGVDYWGALDRMVAGSSFAFISGNYGTNPKGSRKISGSADMLCSGNIRKNHEMVSGQSIIMVSHRNFKL